MTTTTPSPSVVDRRVVLDRMASEILVPLLLRKDGGGGGSKKTTKKVTAKTSSVFSVLLDDPSFHRSVPTDVLLHSCDDDWVDAHRLILALYSDFFKARFAFHVDAKDSENPFAIVDLSQFPQATGKMLRRLVQCLYRGGDGEELLQVVDDDDLFDLMRLADFLSIPTVILTCTVILRKKMATRTEEDRIILAMGVARLADEVCQPRLDSLAVENFLMLAEEPQDFAETVSFRVMLVFLSSPQSFHFRSLRGHVLCRLPAMQLERHLLDMVARFVRHDKFGRLGQATDLLLMLRLSYLIDDLDFDALGLSELNDASRFPQLYQLLHLAHEASKATNLYTCGVPRSLWLPRPGSIKYSHNWTRFYPYAATAGVQGGGPDNIWRHLVFERGIEHHITKLTAYAKTWDGRTIVGGIKLAWSDGTEDVAGHVDETRKDEVELGLGKEASVYIVEYAAIQSLYVWQKDAPPAGLNDRTFGNQGLLKNSSGWNSSWYGAARFAGFCFFDGFSCKEVTNANGKFISCAQVKNSFFVDVALEHLASMKTGVQPSMTVGSIGKEGRITVEGMKRAYRKAKQDGSGMMGLEKVKNFKS